MKTYLFDTTATMKEHNRNKYWIDRNIVSDKYIQANNLTEALKQYVEVVNEKHCISISANALKNKSPMYIDDKNGRPKQIGYVITGKTNFDDGRGRWIEQYIDLWVDIAIITTPDFNAE